MASSSSFANSSFVDPVDFTSDAYYMMPEDEISQSSSKQKSTSKGSIPPLKKARIILKKKLKERENKKIQGDKSLKRRFLRLA